MGQWPAKLNILNEHTISIFVPARQLSGKQPPSVHRVRLIDSVVCDTVYYMSIHEKTLERMSARAHIGKPIPKPTRHGEAADPVRLVQQGDQI